MSQYINNILPFFSKILVKDSNGMFPFVKFIIHMYKLKKILGRSIMIGKQLCVVDVLNGLLVQRERR